MILVVGLGNPGQEYEKTRHNAGFMALNYFLKANDLPDFHLEKKFSAEISEGKIGNPERSRRGGTHGAGEKVILAKPQTFMNNSGKAVAPIAKYFKIKPQNVFVVHDDADLPLGTMKISKNRGSGGHKGIESIIRALKTEDFVRFRVGTRTTKSPKIPHRSKTLMADFVLGKFTPSQELLLKKTIRKCAEALDVAIKESVEKAMSIYNG